jgi:drug/metabolite transporter (DMT)-like permease
VARLGAIVLSWALGAITFNVGALAIAGACVCWAIDNNLTRKLSIADPTMIAMVKGLVAGSVNFALALSQGVPIPRASAAVVGFLGYGVSLVFFVLALRHLGSARTGAYFALAPFIGALTSVIFLHETVTVRLIIAGLLMGAGIYLHLTERHEHEHSHAGMEHEHRHVHDAHHQH